MNVNCLLVITAAFWILAYTARPKASECFGKGKHDRKHPWHRR